MGEPAFKRARTRSRSPPPWRRQDTNPRFKRDHCGPRDDANRGDGRGRGNFRNQHQRRNQEREDRQMQDWLSQEDDFVLKQSKKKAKIRIKEGRAKPIDRLVLLLSIVDPSKDPLEDELDNADLETRDPLALLKSLSVAEFTELQADIQHYLVLEHNEVNLIFWESLNCICKHQIQEQAIRGSGRGIGSVSADVERLLIPKSLEQLLTLESQINQKLQSDETIDEEYWEQLLENVVLYKAKAQLKKFYIKVNETRLHDFRSNQIAAARQVQETFPLSHNHHETPGTVDPAIYAGNYDPAPLLKLGVSERGLKILDEDQFRAEVAQARIDVLRAGYTSSDVPPSRTSARQRDQLASETKSSSAQSALTNAMYAEEEANGLEEDEEVFGNDDEVNVVTNSSGPDRNFRRKPMHFNRVQMGYEWNKYNQTHYDHDNPPPKVVQGYKFNIFYPDLDDKTKAPTYRIEREHGRKKGQSLAPAGEEDTCIIKFMSGTPYQDIAFRIVDREWDYSARRERGFRSSFEKGVLQLHFQFKKIYYRK